MTKYFVAIAADGSVLMRSSETRTYTHAWTFIYTHNTTRGPVDVRRAGFSGSLELATRSGQSELNAYWRTGRNLEVVKADEVCPAEFKRIRKEALASNKLSRVSL